MTAREIMTSPVIAVGPTDTVGDIARLLSQHHISAVPVVDPGSRLLGIVTEADLVGRAAHPHVPHYIPFMEGVIFVETPKALRTFEEEVRRIMAVTAEQIMSTEVAAVGPDATVEEVATRMVEEDQGRLVVVDDGRVVGIVTQADIVRTLVPREEP